MAKVLVARGDWIIDNLREVSLVVLITNIYFVKLVIVKWRLLSLINTLLRLRCRNCLTCVLSILYLFCHLCSHLLCVEQILNCLIKLLLIVLWILRMLHLLHLVLRHIDLLLKLILKQLNLLLDFVQVVELHTRVHYRSGDLLIWKLIWIWILKPAGILRLRVLDIPV